MSKNESWKNKILIVGGLVGALVGVGAAFLYIRTAEEAGGRREISPGQVLKLAVSALGMIRQASQLAE
jgi:hypothetical protein